MPETTIEVNLPETTIEVNLPETTIEVNLPETTIEVNLPETTIEVNYINKYTNITRGSNTTLVKYPTFIGYFGDFRKRWHPETI